MADRYETISEAVNLQVNRTAYPDGFPPLPEIPAARYSDPQFYDLEMKHFWPKTWLHAGHMSEFPSHGSYKLFEQLGLSVIVIRDVDGEIRAFHNICRHRASALLLEPQGVARRFVCPYHSWGYSSEGSLVSVPEAHDFACLDKSKRGLVPVRCETVKGMIFINLDPDATPLSHFLAPMDRQAGDFPIQDMVVKGTIAIEMACNWKAAYDNFLEVYHVSTVHARSIAAFLDSKSFTVSLYENGHSRFVTRKRGSATLFDSELERSEKPDELFMDFTVAMPTFPNCFTALDPIGFTWQTFWPAGPDKTIMIATMMGWKDDSETDKAFWEGMRGQIQNIVSEDLRLFASIQRSLTSGIISGILMGYQERALYWYQEEIDRQIGPENIPADLRITPLLAGHVSRT